jgi:hypothetical protein
VPALQDALRRHLERGSISVQDSSVYIYYQEIRRRISEIGALQDGWLDGDGDKPAEAVVEFLRRIDRLLAQIGPPRVRIYPTVDGGIQLAWQRGGFLNTLEIEADLSAVVESTPLEQGRGLKGSRTIERIGVEDVLSIMRDGRAA